MQLEQSIEIETLPVVDITPVQSHHCGVAHIQARASQQPKLEGNVEDEDILEPGRGLDLYQPPATARQNSPWYSKAASNNAEADSSSMTVSVSSSASSTCW